MSIPTTTDHASITSQHPHTWQVLYQSYFQQRLTQLHLHIWPFQRCQVNDFHRISSWKWKTIFPPPKQKLVKYHVGFSKNACVFFRMLNWQAEPWGSRSSCRLSFYIFSAKLVLRSCCTDHVKTWHEDFEPDSRDSKMRAARLVRDVCRAIWQSTRRACTTSGDGRALNVWTTL